MLNRISSFFSPNRKKKLIIGDIVGSNNANMSAWQLQGLSAAMTRTNFMVSLKIIGFMMLTDKAFSINLLRTFISPNNNQLPVNGVIEEVNLETVQNGIDEVLFWSTGGSELNDARSNALRTIFWDIVFDALPNMPKKYFIHKPTAKSYFGDAPVEMDYTFIIIAGTYGIILAGYGSD